MDGIILDPDTLSVAGLEQEYMDNVKKYCHCPIVCIQNERDGYYRVASNEDTIMEGIITHFIEVHKFTRINYLSGPKGGYVAEKRLESYRRVLKNHGIEVEEERIYYGDFWKKEAANAVEYWLNSTLEPPQAIVCANDYMAISVCKALAKRGIAVPEQIAVSGCDDVEEAEDFIPAITSVRIPSEEMGRAAVMKIHMHHMGMPQPRETNIDTSIIIRSSCGCDATWQKKISDRKLAKIETGDYLENELLRVALMSTSLTGYTRTEDVLNKISDYFFGYEFVSHFCLCLRDNWHSYEDSAGTLSSEHSDKMIMEIGYKNRVPLGGIILSKKELIPHILIEDQPMTFYIALLHNQEYCFGYIGFRPEIKYAPMQTLQAWLNNISSVLENLRTRMEMQRLVYQLEDMTIRDVLTGLYNRRVLDTLGRRCLEQSIRANQQLMVFTADLDKLKLINDKYGHSKGDDAIKEVANALQDAALDDEICIRLGGDEFAAIGIDYDEEKLSNFVNRFVEHLDRYNQSENLQEAVYVSYGWYIISPKANTTLEECLSQADSHMYQQKYHKMKSNVRANLVYV